MHRVVQHRSALAGVEAMTLYTERAFPRHAHDQYGVGIMMRGAQRSWSLLGQVESEAGDVIMTNPGEMHDGAPMGGAREWRIAYLDPALVSREIAGDATTDDFVIRPVARDRRLARQVARLFRQLDDPAPGDMAVEESLVGCLMRLAQMHTVRGPRALPASPPLRRAIQRLEEAPEKAPSLAELAALAGVSRFQLLRGFAREAGATPHAYLVQLRVQRVRRLLAADVPLVEAALAAGFADQSHMTRAFVRQLGVTPGQYRALVR